AGMTTPMTSVTPPAEQATEVAAPPAPIEEPEPSAEAEEDEPSDETSDETSEEPIDETSEELSEDPFAAWPQAQSAEVIEDVPDTEPVQHVAGEIDVPDGYTVLEGTPSGHRRSVAVVVSRYNGGVTNRMLAVAIDTLEEAGVASEAVTIMPVPGAFELPLR